MAITLEQLVQNLTDGSLMSVDEMSAFQDSLPAEKQPKDAPALASELVEPRNSPSARRTPSW